ncbi:MAG: DUF177 domain-containing protein [Verrucomicrobiae bacterium]|nr:DUF177 domain-containing protein [Verrucomicrobiae bacterium]
MKINLRHLSVDPRRYEGEEAPAFLADGSQEIYHFEEPVRYDVEASLTGGSLLVRGRLETTVRATCVRTLKAFDLPVVVEDFTVLIEEPAGDLVDLTPSMREDILLALPAHPVCPEADASGNLPTAHETFPAEGNQAWAQLEQWKGKLGSKKK